MLHIWKIVIAMYFVISLCISSFGQTIELEGSITSSEKFPLIGASIQYDVGRGTSTNEEGYFKLTLQPSEAYRFRIQMLGYASIDTLISAQELPRFWSIILQPKIVDQVEIVVSSSKKTVFEQEDWTILDFKVVRDGLLMLIFQSGERSLHYFNANGILLQKLSLAEKYNQLHISCSDRIHLVGEHRAAEFLFDKKINLVKEYTTAQFEQLVAACLVKKDQQYLFQQYKKHNQELSFFSLEKGKKPLLLHQVVNAKAMKAAASHFQSILRMYYRAMHQPEEGAIDEGIERINLIEKGEWRGDLQDLIVNNKIHEYVSYFKNVIAQPLKVVHFNYGDQYWVFDFNAQTVGWFPMWDQSLFKPVDIADFDWDANYLVLQDQSSEKCYLLKDKTALFQLELEEQTIRLKFVRNLPFYGAFARNIQINEGLLYYIAQISMASPFTKIFQINIE